MMPNKKNPDPAELVRGRAGARRRRRWPGSLALLKGLPLAYQRDLQEDKPPLFEALRDPGGVARRHGRDGRDALSRPAGDARAADEGFTTATAVADALVRRGVPFRAAHHVVGRLVAEAERRGVALADLEDAAIEAALDGARDATASALAGDPGIAGELREAASVEAALASCDVVGGTAPGRVAAALAAARERLGSP